MNLDTNIALGVRPPPIDFNAMNQGNVLANMAQLRSAENQNALAQYTLASAKRTDDSQTALNEAYKGAIDPTTGKVDYPRLYANLASGGAAQHIPKVVEQQNAQRKNDTDEAVHRAKLVLDTTASYKDMLGGINTKNDAIKWLQMQLSDPNMAGSPLTRQGIMDGAKKIPEDAAGLADWKNKTALGMQKYIELNKAQFLDTGNEFQARSSLTGMPLAGVASVPKAPTPGDVMTDTRSKQQFAQTQGLAREKFTWEKANPGMTYVEGPSETAFGYNPKTNQMTPITNAPAAGTNAMAPAGGANTNALAAPAPAQAVAPSAAPVAKPPAAAGAAGPMGITLPANAAAGVNAPGTPFVGKGKETPAEFMKIDKQLANLTNNIKAYKEELASDKWAFPSSVPLPYGQLPLPVGKDSSAIKAKYVSMLMGVKELYELGALTGPDLPLLEQQITNPASWTGALTSRAAMMEQVKILEDMVANATQNLGSAYSKTPKASKPSVGNSNAVTNPSFPGFSIPAPP